MTSPGSPDSRRARRPRRGSGVGHVATLEFAGPDKRTGAATARVRPETVPADDLLARIDGVANALTCRARPVGEVTISGPVPGRSRGPGVC